ncbi:MAG: hypothetical protein RTU63_04910 [Candidatus Thorarchaeota archaeon]
MNKATNYWNFINLFAERTLINDCPPEVVFLALYHASRIQDPVGTRLNSKAVAIIVEAHPDLPLARPFRYPSSVYSLTYADAKDLIENAIKSSDNVAVQFYLLMKLYRGTEHMSIEETITQERIVKLLTENEQLSLLSADYYGHTGFRMRIESNPDGAYENYARALRLARESDDKWHQASLLTMMGEIHSQFRAGPDSDTKSKQFLGEAMELARSLGDQICVATILENITVYSIGRGELGEALDCALEAISVKSSIGGSIGADAYNLAMIYGELDEGSNSLEWAKTCYQQWGPTEPHSFLVMAFAHTTLGNFNTGQELLDMAKEGHLKHGLEMALGVWNSISGKLERRRGNFIFALQHFEQALDISMRASRWRRVRRALYDLSLTELDMFNLTEETRDANHSGPWMKKFEKLVWEQDISGYLGRLMLLKAELRLMQERYKEAEQILDAALELTDSRETRFLYSQILLVKEKYLLNIKDVSHQGDT